MRGRVDHAQQVLISLLLHPLINRPGHGRRGRIAPGRVTKDECIIKLYLLHQIASLPIIAFVLTRKTDNHIGREGNARARPANALDQIPIFPGGVRTMHGLKNAVRSRLERKMNVFGQLRELGQRLDKVIAKSNRVR